MIRICFVACVWLVIFVGAFEDPIFIDCPSISYGSPPFCTCRYGPTYDNETNTCPNPECPKESRPEPTYPNCICTTKNADYSAYLNECFRVCPEDSNGYWPNCVCDDKRASFDKKLFKCVRCPEGSNENDIYPKCDCGLVGKYDLYNNECTKCVEGSTGIYPNCSCIDTNSGFIDTKNACESCPPGSLGKIPNCTCDNGAEYNRFGNYCEKCPYGTSGEFPNCECSDGGYFNEQMCKYCPWGANGTYPNCICKDGETYVQESDLCFMCPNESTGHYPSCICEDPLKYDLENNLCVECPVNSNGTYPNCTCSNGFYSIDSNVCIECPINSTGTHPDCECEGEDHMFSSYINQCYIECGAGSTGLQPYCRCDMPDTYYEAAEFTCKSNNGRKCPPSSIGIGPDCLCIEENSSFNEHQWGCYGAGGATFAHYTPTNCPDKGQKWPQCSGIDRNALLSLVG